MSTVESEYVKTKTVRVSRNVFWRGIIYPNGEFSFCRQKTFSLDKDISTPCRQEDRDWASTMVRMHGVLAAIRAFAEYRPSGEVPLGEQTLDGRLDLSIGSNSEKKIYGLKGLTSRGKRRVRNAAYLLEKSYGTSRLSFLTLTLPSVSLEGYGCISGNWGSIVELICKAIRRRLRDAGLPSSIVGVTEVQEKRLRRHGGIPLHLHLVFVGRHPRGAWQVRAAHIRKSWRDAVKNFLPEKDRNASFDSSENVTRVRRSCSRYLAKYMSKGVEVIKELTSRFPNIRLPKQWYTCSRDLVQQIESQKKVPDIHTLEMLVYAVMTKDKEVVKCVSVKELIGFGGSSYVIAGCGWLTSQGRKLVEGLMTSPSERLSVF